MGLASTEISTACPEYNEKQTVGFASSSFVVCKNNNNKKNKQIQLAYSAGVGYELGLTVPPVTGFGLSAQMLVLHTKAICASFVHRCWKQQVDYMYSTTTVRIVRNEEQAGLS